MRQRVVPAWLRWILLLLFQTFCLFMPICLHCCPQRNDSSPSDLSGKQTLDLRSKPSCVLLPFIYREVVLSLQCTNLYSHVTYNIGYIVHLKKKQVTAESSRLVYLTAFTEAEKNTIKCIEMCVQQCICILMLFLLFAIQFHNVSIDHNPNPHLLSPSFIPLFTKKPQELAGKAPRPCSVSSPCHTCCCNGVHHAHSGAPTGWSCKLCKSMEACGQSHRRHSRPVTPSGHQYN